MPCNLLFQTQEAFVALRDYGDDRAPECPSEGTPAAPHHGKRRAVQPPAGSTRDACDQLGARQATHC